MIDHLIIEHKDQNEEDLQDLDSSIVILDSDFSNEFSMNSKIEQDSDDIYDFKVINEMNEDEGSLNERFSDEDHFSENYEQHTLTESEITDPSEITDISNYLNRKEKEMGLNEEEFMEQVRQKQSILQQQLLIDQLNQKYNLRLKYQDQNVKPIIKEIVDRNLKAKEITEQRQLKKLKNFRELKPDTELLLDTIRKIEGKYNLANAAVQVLKVRLNRVSKIQKNDESSNQTKKISIMDKDESQEQMIARLKDENLKIKKQMAQQLEEFKLERTKYLRISEGRIQKIKIKDGKSIENHQQIDLGSLLTKARLEVNQQKQINQQLKDKVQGLNEIIKELNDLLESQKEVKLIQDIFKLKQKIQQYKDQLISQKRDNNLIHQIKKSFPRYSSIVLYLVGKVTSYEKDQKNDLYRLSDYFGKTFKFITNKIYQWLGINQNVKKKICLEETLQMWRDTPQQIKNEFNSLQRLNSILQASEKQLKEKNKNLENDLENITMQQAFKVDDIVRALLKNSSNQMQHIVEFDSRILSRWQKENQDIQQNRQQFEKYCTDLNNKMVSQQIEQIPDDKSDQQKQKTSNFEEDNQKKSNIQDIPLIKKRVFKIDEDSPRTKNYKMINMLEIYVRYLKKYQFLDSNMYQEEENALIIRRSPPIIQQEHTKVTKKKQNIDKKSNKQLDQKQDQTESIQKKQDQIESIQKKLQIKLDPLVEKKLPQEKYEMKKTFYFDSYHNKNDPKLAQPDPKKPKKILDLKTTNK